jgi:hypothetical protein
LSYRYKNYQYNSKWGSIVEDYRVVKGKVFADGQEIVDAVYEALATAGECPEAGA